MSSRLRTPRHSLPRAARQPRLISQRPSAPSSQLSNTKISSLNPPPPPPPPPPINSLEKNATVTPTLSPLPPPQPHDHLPSSNNLAKLPTLPHDPRHLPQRLPRFPPNNPPQLAGFRRSVGHVLQDCQAGGCGGEEGCEGCCFLQEESQRRHGKGEGRGAGGGRRD